MNEGIASVESSDRSESLWSGLMGGLMVLYGLPALGLFLSKWLSLGPAMGIVFCAMVPAGFALGRKSEWALLPGFLGLMLSYLVISFTVEEEKFSEAQSLPNATVSQAASSLEAEVFRFKNAVIQTKYTKSHSYRVRRKNNSNTYTFEVAPLTDADWQPEQPVEAWVVASNISGLASELQVAVRIEASEHEAQAVKNACQEHGLNSSETPLMLNWKDPYSELAERARWMRERAHWPALIWLALYFLIWLRSLGQSRPKPQTDRP